MSATADRAYVVRMIQFLGERHNLHPFITTREFDVLYHWWEKNVPAELAEEAITAVVDRARARGRALSGFSSFAAEVRKRHKALLSMQAGGGGRAEPVTEDEAVRFMAEFPEELTSMRVEFENYFVASRDGRTSSPADAEALRDKVLALFEEDGELNGRCEHFMANLAPPLRRPDIRRTYRLNFLWRRLHIPELE